VLPQIEREISNSDLDMEKKGEKMIPELREKRRILC
jgi:hypothetical protein